MGDGGGMNDVLDNMLLATRHLPLATYRFAHSPLFNDG